MPITVGSLQVFDLVDLTGPPPTWDVTVNVGSATTGRVLWFSVMTRPGGQVLSAVFDPGGLNLNATQHTTGGYSPGRNCVMCSVRIPSWASGTYTLHTTYDIAFIADFCILARVINGVDYAPVNAYAEFDPTFPFTPVCPLGMLSAGNLVMASANIASPFESGFGDWSASTQTLTATWHRGYHSSDSGGFGFADGILNGVTGGVPFTVTMTGNQIGSAGAIAYRAFTAAPDMEATASITEDDDTSTVVQEIIATYLGSTEGNTWPATVVTQSVNIGSAEATRQIVGVIGMGESGCHPTGGTFAGVVATVDVQQAGSGTGFNIGIVRAFVPTGSGSQTLSITVTPYTGPHHVDWYSITGAQSDPVDIGSTNDLGPASVDVDGVAGGLVLAGSSGTGGGSWTLIGFDFSNSDATEVGTVTGYDAVTAAGTVNVADTGGGSSISMAAISLAPFVAGATADIQPPMRAIASLTEDDDYIVIVNDIVAAYLGTTTGDTAGSGVVSASINIGAAEATRQIVAVVREGAGGGASAGTFAGVAATVDVFQANSGGGRGTTLLHAPVPSGSGSQTLSVTVPTFSAYIIDWYSVVGAQSTLVDVGSDGVNNPLIATVDGVAGGLILAGMAQLAAGPPYTFPGFDFVQASSYDTNFNGTSGYDTVVADGTINVTEDAVFQGSSLAAISFRPFAITATAEIQPPARAVAILNEADDYTSVASTVVASYLGTTKGTGASASNVINASINIGAAEATRQIVAVVLDEIGDGASAGTFAGVVASIDVYHEHDSGGRATTILRASVPSGSGSQTLSVTIPGSGNNYVVDWYSVTGASQTRVDVAGTGDNGPLTFSIDGEASGLLLAGGAKFGGGSMSIIGFDFEHHDSQGLTSVSGYDAVAATGPVTVTDDGSFSNSSMAALSLERIVSSSATAEIIDVVTGVGVAVSLGTVIIMINGGATVSGQALTVSLGRANCPNWSWSADEESEEEIWTWPD